MRNVFLTDSLQDNNKIIDEIIDNVRTSAFILLSGDLGAGKTTFTKMLLKAIGVETMITSPTFNILHQYKTRDGIVINHMDAYRLDKQSDIEMFVELFDDGINVIEWWENLDYDFSNTKVVKIFIEQFGEKRKFIIESS